MDCAGSILASTYFGGQGSAAISGIAADVSGNIYIAGSTTSPDFPAPPASGATMFVAKFDSSLNLLYATFVPGAGSIAAIAADSAGSAVLTGANASSSPTACFAAKLAPDGSRTLFFTAFGGTGGDLCTAVAVDSAGAVCGLFQMTLAAPTYPTSFTLGGSQVTIAVH